MILGFFIVRPIPLPPSEPNRTNASLQYEELEADAAAVGVDLTSVLPVPQQRHGDEAERYLLAKDPSDEDTEAESESVTLSPSTSANQSARQRSVSAHGRRSISKHSVRSKEALNIYGLGLFRSLDFWLLFSTLALRMFRLLPALPCQPLRFS